MNEIDLGRNPATLEDAHLLFNQILTFIGDRFLMGDVLQAEVAAAKKRADEVKTQIKNWSQKKAPEIVTDEIPLDEVVYSQPSGSALEVKPSV